MDSSPKAHGKENPCAQTSPNSSTSHSSSSSSSNGISPLPLPTTPSPRPVHRSEPPTPCPNSNGATTFVQADTSSFKQVVQMLTGSSKPSSGGGAGSGAAHDPGKVSIPPIRTGGPKKPAFKLYERRGSLKNIKLSPLLPGLRPGAGGVPGFSPRQRHQPEILSPSVLDFPSLVLSPVTPLIPDPFNRPGSAPPPSIDQTAAEERAIAEKGFYLHPSPRSTSRDPEPRLLPLFPVTSPKVSSGSSS